MFPIAMHGVDGSEAPNSIPSLVKSHCGPSWQPNSNFSANRLVESTRMGLKGLPYTYEVLEYDARVELLDTDGRNAQYTRTELVRFLKDTSTVYDYGWGNGIAFAEHETGRGKFTEKKLLGSRLRATVKLPELQHKGDEFVLTFERTVRNGFMSPSECWLEAELYHPTRRLTLCVVLPAARPLREACLVTLEEPKGTALRPVEMADGRQCISYKARNPRVGQRFTLLWDW